MTAAPLAAALASLALARSPAKRMMPGCVGMDDAHLYEAVIKAEELAQSCLIGDKLNPGLGARLLKPEAKRKPSYHCDYSLGSLAVTPPGDKPNIAVSVADDRPAEATSVRAPRPLDLTVFHELLHAADPGTQLVSLYVHNHAPGFPDGINGCEAACAGEIREQGAMSTRLFEKSVRALEQDKAYACPEGSDGDDCALLRKYARLCRDGAPALTADQSKALRRLQAAYCVEDNLDKVPDDSKNPLIHRILQAYEDSQTGATDDGKLARALAGFVQAIKKTQEEADFAGLAWLATFLSANQCPSL